MSPKSSIDKSPFKTHLHRYEYAWVILVPLITALSWHHLNISSAHRPCYPAWCCQLSTQWSVKLTEMVCIWVPWLWCGEVDCRSHQLCIISLFTNATFSVQENQLWRNTVLCVNKFVIWIVALSWNNWSCWDLPSTKAKTYLAHWGWDKLAIILL